jgi:hypothetical protein
MEAVKLFLTSSNRKEKTASAIWLGQMIIMRIVSLRCKSSSNQCSRDPST